MSVDSRGVFLYTDLMIKTKKYNLLNYFIYDNKDLPKAYVKRCEKFLKELNDKKRLHSNRYDTKQV